MDLLNVPIAVYDAFMVKIYLLLLAGGLMASDMAVPYPEGYRQWNHLHSTMLAARHSSFGKDGCKAPCTSGVMHFYANAKAMKGFKTGTFPDGAIIADEVLEIHQAEGAISGTEGPRRGVGVMVRDSKRYASTGGWGYGAYAADTKTDTLNEKTRDACFQCHVSKKASNYVFTQYRDR